MKKIFENEENGRSMIEMLGVLAIIGVLSVGGIAGYSKAMHRYRVNKTIDQITYMAGAIRTFFAPQKSYNWLSSGNNTGRQLLKKAKLVPDNMWNGDSLQSVWGNNVGIYAICRTQEECNNGLTKAFDIDFYNIPEEACIDLLTQDWSNVGDVVLNTYSEANEIDLYAIPPMSVDKAVAMCEKANVNNAMEVYFLFDIDVNDSYWKGDIDATTALLNGE